MDTQDFARRSLLVGTGFAGLSAAAAISRGASSAPAGGGTVMDIVLAGDLQGLTVGADVTAIRTAGYHVPGIGGALYVADARGDAGLPFLETRDGRRFFLADDELREA